MSLLKNGILWKDVHGEPIHAHGGTIIFHEGYFYWYGEDRRENYYVSCYRSTNLTDWEFRRHVCHVGSLRKREELSRCGSGAIDGAVTGAGILSQAM